MKKIVVILSIALSFNSFSQILKSGQWLGIIHFKEGDIPFTIEIGYPMGEVPQFTIVNGTDRKVIDNVRQQGDSLIIPIDPFDVAIHLKYYATTMNGTFYKFYRNDAFPFSAFYGKPRITKKSTKQSVSVENRWDMTFEPKTSSMSKGIGLFSQKGEQITGTIMTNVSDYRFFEGIVDGDSLKMTCFDGIHAYKLLGNKTNKGWVGKIVMDDTYAESWIANPDDKIEFEDPFKVVMVDSGVYKPYYDLLGAGSGKASIDPSNYEGKVLIIQLFGTWCPNSQDQTVYLTNWYKKNRDRDVAILASSYEANYTQEYGLSRIEAYKKFNDIDYDVVLGGRLSKVSAALPFPFMERIAAFPTLVILDKKGFVRYVHNYFNGPATGAYYHQFDVRFNSIIDELLAE